MCLTISSNKTTKEFFQRLTKAGKRGILAYKIYSLGPFDRLYSPYFHKSQQIKPGIVISDRKNKCIENEEELCSEVYKGIHVFMSSRDARRLVRNGQTVVAVKVRKDDLVAVGHWDESSHPSSAVFMKVEMSKKEYWKTLGFIDI